MKIKVALGLFSLLGVIASSYAQTVWTDGAGDQMWSSTANWNTGIVPISTTNVQIGTQPTGDQIGIDTGGIVTVASFTFNNTLTASVDIAPLADETLQINGDITNNSAFTDTFSIGVIAGASAVWTGPLSFTSPAAIGANTITLVNAVSFSGLTLDVTGASTSGKFAGAGSLSLSGGLIFNFTAVTGAGSWDIASQSPTGSLTGVSLINSYSGAFTETTPGSWDAVASGLTWNYSEATGVLTAVPEPATWALLATGLTTMMIFRPRRRRD